MFETVSSKHVLTDGAREIDVYPIEGSGHNDAFVMVYLPREKILIQADAFTPGPPGAPPPAPPNNANALALVDTIERLKLDVERHLPLQRTDRAQRGALPRRRKVARLESGA